MGTALRVKLDGNLTESWTDITPGPGCMRHFRRLTPLHEWSSTDGNRGAERARDLRPSGGMATKHSWQTTPCQVTAWLP